jgi:hypothetical protein
MPDSMPIFSSLILSARSWLQFFVGLAYDVFHRGVHGDGLDLREDFIDFFRNDLQFVRAEHKRVGSGQENAFCRGINTPHRLQITLNLLHGRHAERNAVIHGTEGAGVVAAAGSDLNQKRVCLKGRTKNRSCVCHD